jgi:hypothetical protein
MPAKRYSVEQIVGQAEEAERLQAQGRTIAQVCKRSPWPLRGARSTSRRWRCGSAERSARLADGDAGGFVPAAHPDSPLS